MIHRKLIWVFLLIILSFNSFGQDAHQSPSIFIEPDISLGRIVPNYSNNYPSSGVQKSFFLSVGKVNFSPQKKWATFYNFPTTGITINYTDYGNNKVFGQAIALLPYVSFNSSKTKEHSFHFKFGMGVSYFNKYYSKDNTANDAIGSHLNWSFLIFSHYTFLSKKNFVLRGGGGYLHNSNGHTQLPNFGLNSALLSVSAQFHLHLKNKTESKDAEWDNEKHYFISSRSGVGIQEFGGTTGPIGGNKKGVYVQAISFSKKTKKFAMIHSGFTYRYYQHYFDYITEKKPSVFINRPVKNSSELYFFLGYEFLFGQVGVDLEGGLNLYKPFFKTFNKMYERDNSLLIFLKSMFPARLGLKLYLINTSKNPKNNLFIAGHINSNFGIADFSELSFGYVRLIK